MATSTPDPSEPSNFIISTPRPDPTTLTNELVSRATTALRDVIESRLDGSEALLHEKIRALTEAMAVFKQTVNERFELGAQQTDKAADAAKTGLDAAFAAAKEAVGVQSTSFTKQIDQLGDSVKQIVKTTDDKIDDLKARIAAMEGRKQGYGDIGAIIVGAALAIGVVVDIAVHFTGH